MRALSSAGRRSTLMLAIFALIAAACVNTGGTDNEGQSPGEQVQPITPKVPEENVTIRFSVFSSVAESPQMKKFEKTLEQKYPTIDVEFEPVGSGQAREKLLTQIAGGNAPDAAFVDAGLVQDLAARGALTNLDGYIAGSNVVAEED